MRHQHQVGALASLAFVVMPDHLHWLFALIAFVLISGNGKRWFWPFLTTIGLLWAIVDFLGILGWLLVPLATFLMAQFIMTIYFRGTYLESHYLKVVVVLFLMLSFINTFYFRMVSF